MTRWGHFSFAFARLHAVCFCFRTFRKYDPVAFFHIAANRDRPSAKRRILGAFDGSITVIDVAVQYNPFHKKSLLKNIFMIHQIRIDNRNEQMYYEYER